MGTHDEIAAGLETKFPQNGRAIDAWTIVGQNLAHGAARLDDTIGCDALGEQIFPRDRRVGQVDVRSMVDDATVDLLRDALIETPVSRFHMEDWNLPSFGWKDGEAGIGVSQDEHRVGLLGYEHLVNFDDYTTDGFCGVSTRRAKKVVGLSYFEVLEEDLVQFVVVILARMDQHMVRVFVEPTNHAGQADDLRPGPDHGHDFHARHVRLSHRMCQGALYRKSHSPRAMKSGCRSRRWSRHEPTPALIRPP